MADDKPAQDAPKKASFRAADAPKPNADPAAQSNTGPELRNPAEWAVVTGRTRKRTGGLSVNGITHAPSPFTGDHRAASIRHRWAEYPAFRCSRADYEAAVKATKTFDIHQPAHAGPVRPTKPFLNRIQKKKAVVEAEAKRARGAN